MTLTLILLLIGAAMLIIAVRSLRAQRLKERHALLMGFLGLPFLVLAVWPDAVGSIGQMLGIQYTTVLLLCMTTFFLLVNFKLLSIVSVQDRRIASLAQSVALLTESLKSGKPQSQNSGG